MAGRRVDVARKRVGGRFAKTGEVPELSETSGAVAAGAMLKAPRPRQCRAYVRKRMAEQMPALVETLMRQANGGSLGHLKILVALAGLDKGEVDKAVKRREKSLEKILLDQWNEGGCGGCAGRGWGGPTHRRSAMNGARTSVCIVDAAGKANPWG